MLSNIRNVVLALAAIMLFVVPVQSKELIQRGWVNDYANVLSLEQTKTLSRRLAAIERDKPDAPQVVVVTYSSLDGGQINDTTIQLAKTWKLGRKERDNGILIAIAPNERKYFVSVGYGLEPSIPDAKTSEIGDKMRAALQSNKTDWNGALTAAVDAVEGMLPTQAYDPDHPVFKPVTVTSPTTVRSDAHTPHNHNILLWVLIIVGVFFVIAWLFRRVRHEERDAEERSSSATYSGSNYRTSGSSYSEPSHHTTVVVVPTPSYDPPARRSSSDWGSSSSSSRSGGGGSDWGSSGSSSDSSSSGGDWGGGGGGDSGGGGGGGDL